ENRVSMMTCVPLRITLTHLFEILRLARCKMGKRPWRTIGLPITKTKRDTRRDAKIIGIMCTVQAARPGMHVLYIDRMQGYDAVEDVIQPPSELNSKSVGLLLACIER